MKDIVTFLVTDANTRSLDCVRRSPHSARDDRSKGGAGGSVDGLQLFAGLKAHCFAGRDGNFGAGAGIASDASFARAHVEHAKAPQFNAIALGERLLHALKDSFDR